MPTCAACHDNQYVFGAGCNGHHVIVGCILQPVGPCAFAVVGPSYQPALTEAAFAEEVVPDILLGIASGGDFLGVFGAQDEEHLAVASLDVVADHA